MRIALIKTSSMGDVIHALPVVSDLLGFDPAMRIDWVVEEAFAELPALHPGVAEVIPVAIRRWRHDWFGREVRAQRRAAHVRIAAAQYDLVLDLQGLFKSAWIARWARGPRAGFSFRCAREPLAALFYHRRFDVDMSRHAIERLRELAGAALGRRFDSPPRFGLRAPSLARCGLDHPADGQDYAVLLHASSRPEKLWPAHNWIALMHSLVASGLTPVLPWGTESERQAAEALARQQPTARVPARMGLSQCAAMIAAARCVVGVDTGLTHLACALDVPSVALFAATPAWRFGPYWSERSTGLGENGQWPSPSEVIDALVRVGAGPIR